MRWTLITLLAVATIACSESASQSSDSTESMPSQSSLDIQGHRGCRGLMPENSIPAFLHALDLGVTTLELDVVISRDSQVIVSHEPWLSDVFCFTPTGDPVPDNSQRDWNLYQMTAEEISRCDCGSRGNPRFPDQQLMPTVKPLLADVIDSVEAYLQTHNLPPVAYNIETKCDPRGDNIFHPEPETFTRLLLEVIDDKGIGGRVMIQSFDPRTLKVAKELSPATDLVLLVEGERDRDERIAELGFIPQVYSPSFDLVDDSLRTWTTRLGMKLIPWTVNDPADMQRMIDLGVDGIITDYPDRLVKLVESAK